MATVTIPLDGGRVSIMATTTEPRQKFEYVDNRRTDKAVTLNGLPVYAFEAAIGLDGQGIGPARVESTTAKLPTDCFGTMLYGQGRAELVISPQDNFNLRVKLTVDRVVDQPTKQGTPAASATAGQPSRAV